MCNKQENFAKNCPNILKKGIHFVQQLRKTDDDDSKATIWGHLFSGESEDFVSEIEKSFPYQDQESIVTAQN